MEKKDVNKTERNDIEKSEISITHDEPNSIKPPTPKFAPLLT